ncbi:hypothetical protein R0J90_05225 [Micrococcus sp. SIMBA_144]
MRHRGQDQTSPGSGQRGLRPTPGPPSRRYARGRDQAEHLGGPRPRAQVHLQRAGGVGDVGEVPGRPG